MSIITLAADHRTIQQLRKNGSSFEVKSKLVLSAQDGGTGYTIVEVPAYTKRYGTEEFDPSSYVDDPDKVAFFAYLDQEPAGQIRLRKYWNGYAYIDDIAVEEEYRRQGVGCRLIEAAIEWAKAKGVPGIMLETQDNNVPACMLYEKCGFVLGGFDTGSALLDQRTGMLC